MKYLTVLVKPIVLISMVIGTLGYLEDQASAQKAAGKPPRRFQRMATLDDLEPRQEPKIMRPRDRLRRRPSPLPEELPPFVKPGERVSSGTLRDLEPDRETTPRRLDATKPIPAPEERKP